MSASSPMCLRGLTIWQPMAWAIVAGHKTIENRSWQPHRGVTHLAIHAGATYSRSHADQIEAAFGIEVPARKALRFGVILCVARIEGTVTDSDDPWFSGPVGWQLADVRPLPRPIERAGSMGLWTLTSEQLANLRSQLKEVC